MGKCSASSGSDPSDNKHEQKLQAVLLTDTFSDAFHPITFEPYSAVGGDGATSADAAAKGRERPLALCPLNNVPLLHHTIGFLQGSGVEELFLLCSSGADALEEYVRSYAGGGKASGNNGQGGGDGGGATDNKIVWSSKLTITTLRFTDCKNVGE
mmetsp:Transcript_36272/g.77346  ORF Transcript_36272/g.77346 Transcript_36272/m.77346 type:complete len:155 (+) Transcript_36272:172-636(+)